MEKTAYQCRQVFTKDVVLCGTKRKIGGSIGIASYPKDTDNLEQLIVCADDAMYQVKKNGKNDFAFYKKPEEEMCIRDRFYGSHIILLSAAALQHYGH